MRWDLTGWMLVATMTGLPHLRADLPTAEAEVVTYLMAKGVKITRNAQGQASRLVSSGQPELTVAEYQLIGRLPHLEDVGLNAAPLPDQDWGFLKTLPKLKKLSIWHAGRITSLQPFSELPVESLTIGGCTGLRDLNRHDPKKLQGVVATLHGLPNLTRLSLYHSPTIPDDPTLAHLAAQFPKLTELRLDFAALPGLRPAVTPAGLRSLQALPLRQLHIETVSLFTTEHFEALAGIPTLTVLHVDARKSTLPTEAISAFQQRRPDVSVVVSAPGEKSPAVPSTQKDKREP